MRVSSTGLTGLVAQIVPRPSASVWGCCLWASCRRSSERRGSLPSTGWRVAPLHRFLPSPRLSTKARDVQVFAYMTTRRSPLIRRREVCQRGEETQRPIGVASLTGYATCTPPPL